jgi:hypothetical protein
VPGRGHVLAYGTPKPIQTGKQPALLALFDMAVLFNFRVEALQDLGLLVLEGHRGIFGFLEELLRTIKG